MSIQLSTRISNFGVWARCDCPSCQADHFVPFTRYAAQAHGIYDIFDCIRHARFCNRPSPRFVATGRYAELHELRCTGRRWRTSTRRVRSIPNNRLFVAAPQ